VSAMLGWMGLATGLVGVVAYFALLLRRPHWVRILNGSGLLLTGMALFQAPVLARLAVGAYAFGLQATLLLLIAAVLVQSLAALRNRRAWDGTERRGLLEGRA
jgi:hypothetical protein